MGSSAVKGVQGENVIATIKHFAFNSMENARFKVNVEADKLVCQRFSEQYL